MENFEHTLEEEVQAAPQIEVTEEQPVAVAEETAPAAPAPRKRRGGRIIKTLVSAILIIALVFTCCGLTAVGVSIYWNAQLKKTTAYVNDTADELRKQLENGGGTTIISPDSETASDEMSPAQVYAQNVDAVVAIASQGIVTNIFGQVSETASSGSGFIISSDGFVVTNFHVISGANRVGVILSDGTEYQANVVGYDKTNDIAVLKIEGTDFPATTFGSSDSLVVGERVAAIGNPLGELSSTLTVGYVSAKDRPVSTDGSYQNMIQTDAAINSGNSGGPLFDMHGDVIGITTAKYSGTSSSGATIEGIGFAIPIDDVRNLIEDLMEFGHIKSGYLGIMAQDMAKEDAELYGLPLGAYVVEVTPDSCAERGGMKAKDIITNLGGQPVESMSDLSRALSKYEGGEEISVTVYRGGGELILTITLDTKPVEQTQQQQPAQQEEVPQQDAYIPEWMYPFG